MKNYSLKAMCLGLFAGIFVLVLPHYGHASEAKIKVQKFTIETQSAQPIVEEDDEDDTVEEEDKAKKTTSRRAAGSLSGIKQDIGPDTSITREAERALSDLKPLRDFEDRLICDFTGDLREVSGTFKGLDQKFAFALNPDGKCDEHDQDFFKTI